MEQEVDGILVAASELKAPLATLRQLAFSLGDSVEENRLIRGEMIDVSSRAIRQINDLIKMRKLEDGLFEMEPVAVRGVCDDALREASGLLGISGRDVAVRYTNRTPLVVANRDLLRSVVYNFLVSAMHYDVGDLHSELLVRDRSGAVRIAVRDYGPALPMDLWREMKRGWIKKPTSIPMRPGSSGLGLFIASSFSKYMHAKVGAVRHRDSTSFYVELAQSGQARLF